MKYLGLMLILGSQVAFAALSAIGNESILVTATNKSESLILIRKAASAAVPATVKSESAGLTVVNRYRPKRKHIKAATSTASLADMTFDFNYSGDVSGLPLQLRSYDPRLVILHGLGSRKPLNINISLQATKIDDISDAVASQTNDQVHVVFNPLDNSIRLNYIGTIDVGQDAVSESLKWQQGGLPRPVLKQDGIVRFPYGEYQPVIICQPLNLCDLELQAGEEIQGIVIGDSLRWNEGDNGIPIVYSGANGNLTPHLVLKPSQGGLDTTLMVTTSKRTYMLKLKSASNGYVARAGFYYPAEMIKTFNTNKEKLRNNNESSLALNPDMQKPLIDLSKVNYAYTVSGDDYSWRPTQVFDDGISVYIQLPDSISSRSLPGICVLVDGDDSETKCEMANFRYNDHFYIVDKLFNQAKLINGYGDYMQVITIKRRPDKPGFWSRLFG